MSANYIVRHGAMRFLGEYEPVPGAAYLRGQQVIIRTERGLEIGEALCPATEQAVRLIAEPTRGQIVRPMSEKDHADAERLGDAELQEFDSCNRYIATRKVQMELVDVVHPFGGERTS